MNMAPEMWTAMGSSLASFLFLFEMFRRYCPPEVRKFLEKTSSRIRAFLYPYVQISIHEFIGSNLKAHEAYTIVEAYLSATTAKSAKRLKAEMVKDSNKLVLSMDEHEKVTDQFNGIKIWWISGKSSSSNSRSMNLSYFPEPDKKYYRLLFHKKYREIITEAYLEHVIKIGKEMNARNRQRKLYTNSTSKSAWSHIVFEHPATFDTLAMEPWKKQEIIEDLQTFTKSKDYYSKIGKAWKRGYLLYGPPGTGKSTMIAAMANLLDFDVYDLELTSVRDNSELRRLLTETTNKSIIVIEDIDCSLDLTGQRKKPRTEKSESEKGKKESSRNKEESGSKVTLSGLLNFIDGLWSACGGERLIVFTTNYVDKLDPALTRRGRMDKHVELSYCSFEGFKVLARNYLNIEEEKHPMFHTIEQLLMETKITPADVAENLMPKSPKEDADKCLKNLIHVLEEAKSKQQHEAMNVVTEELGQEKAEISPVSDEQQTHQD
ncbi:hypothetical protein Leryth_006564 [Lithospermum erythrorhizon]|nr:hypothetical protein Leryth_006564 [Lithospermum erythrorhizon]